MAWSLGTGTLRPYLSQELQETVETQHAEEKHEEPTSSNEVLFAQNPDTPLCVQDSEILQLRSSELIYSYQYLFELLRPPLS